MPMKSLFLQAPSFDGYDGGAGARYQMKREATPRRTGSLSRTSKRT
jgi:hypothetical protein